jgi:hypothetical protein
LDALTLSLSQEQVLREQTIDADQPGPVLHDFQIVLDFVGTQGVKAAGKYNLLPLSAVGELDARLSRPLRLKLKRPQLRSHPYLQGLHLLLRASGLGRIAGAGEKARLALDPTVLGGWRSLNSTEQYFTLLEAWLFLGRPEMVGERGGASGESLMSFFRIWAYYGFEGRTVDLERMQQGFFFQIATNPYQLALMDLFGLVEVKPVRRDDPFWDRGSTRFSPFGNAVLALLVSGYFRSRTKGSAVQDEWNEDDELSEGQADKFRFGRLQPVFQPYFPEWHNNLILPQAEAHVGVYVFRVSLGEVWRRIAISSADTLDDLLACILRSVKFDNDHLYEFAYRDRFGTTVHALHPECDEGPWADQIPIGELPLEPGQSMQLTYDFGDNWQFDIKLESIDLPNQRLKAPRVVESHGKAPEQYPDWD